MKKILEFITGRLFFLILSMLIQVALLVFLILFLARSMFLYVYITFTAMSFITILVVMGKKDNPVYKLSWILPIAIFPIFGWFIYFLAGRAKKTKKMAARMEHIEKISTAHCTQDPATIEELSNTDPEFLRHASYISNTSLLPIYKGTETKYLPLGEIFFAELCQELEKAKHFIFMEYFILQEGKMWDTILGILARKVTEGVEVKLIYDDIGCIQTLPRGYHKRLRSLGIEVEVFNVARASSDVLLNYRDHRKITVIDGNVGFMGGNNLADEYINAIVKHGHWKDSSLMLKGIAVWNLSIMFLQMWQYNKPIDIDYNKYRPTAVFQDDGYVLPFGDGPLDEHLTGEMAYMNIINRANEYVSITTPYLILDNEMITSICAAASSGVKIRIFTPAIPDKWYVHAVTRYNYTELIKSGVEIYEYTRGFIHAKTIVSDHKLAIVGTQNFDFRSFYLHFECGTLLYKTKSVMQVHNDHEELLKVSRRITLAECIYLNPLKRFLGFILHLFAPMM